MTKLHKLYVPAFFNRRHDGSYCSARKILEYMFQIYKPYSVVDVGCGSGAWLKAAADLGASELVGLDGDWVDLRYFEGTSINFVAASLQSPIFLDKRFDLAISVEVIEHLSPDRGESFVEDLCRASDVIIFSGAIPDQGGIHHVNEQWQSHWISIFERYNYKHFDVFRAKFWYDKEIASWYRQNLFLFVNDACLDLVDVDKMEIKPITDVAHPEIYQSAPRTDYISGRVILKALSHVLARQWRRFMTS